MYLVVVAQICNLPCRGFAIRTARRVPARWELGDALPNTIRRYSPVRPSRNQMAGATKPQRRSAAKPQPIPKARKTAEARWPQRFPGGVSSLRPSRLGGSIASPEILLEMHDSRVLHRDEHSAAEPQPMLTTDYRYIENPCNPFNPWSTFFAVCEQGGLLQCRDFHSRPSLCVRRVSAVEQASRKSSRAAKIPGNTDRLQICAARLAQQRSPSCRIHSSSNISPTGTHHRDAG